MTWPRSSLRGSRLSQLNERTASSEFNFMTAGSPANTKGSYTQITSSCPFDADGFFLQFGGSSTNSTFDALVDVAVGGAGSEQVILSNFLVSVSGFIAAKVSVFIPLKIAAGQRIAVRCQASIASATLGMGLQVVAGNFFSDLAMGRATTYGADTSDSGGTQVDPGGSANTKGSWAQIVASTTNPIRHMVICVGSRANGVYDASATSLQDIGVGGAGSEQVLVDDLFAFVTTATDVHDAGAHNRSVSVAAGQRLAARAQTTVTDATDRLRDIVIIGFD